MAPRPLTMWGLLLATLPLVAHGVDLTLYGGAFESSTTTAYAEVAQTCFGGLEVGSCEPSSPNWLIDFLDQYNEGTTGAYCASCCSNTDSVGDTWAFTCPLLSSSFADFVNLFAWEFRFRRRETASDTGVVTCAIPRTACSYDEDGNLSGVCESDGSYLVAYVLTIEVMTVEKGVQSWKSVRSCSVEVEESTEEPTSLSETVVMSQVYASGSGIERGWAALIALVAFSVVSCGIRYARDDRCRICGHHLIWFRKVCLPCRFYGYDPPSKDVMEIIREKRSVVLPEPTLSERIGTVQASTTKVFVQATEGLRSTTRFASTRFAKQKHAPNLGNSSAVTDGGGEGAGGGPPRNEANLDPYGDAAAASGNRSGNEGAGTGGRRPGDTTGRGGPRGRGATVFSSIERGTSPSRGGTSPSAPPARGRVRGDTTAPPPDLAAVGTGGSDETGTDRTAVLKPALLRS